MTPTTTIMIIFVMALICAVTATPLARRCAEKFNFYDQPASRKLHRFPVPLLGGVAIYVAIVSSIVLFGHHFLQELAGVLIGCSIMAVTGLFDDHRQLPSWLKWAIQILISCGLFLSGVQVSLGWFPLWANFLLTLFWLTGITNAINFLDNMDGLSCGVSAIAAAFFTVIASMNGQYMVASLAAAVLGACIGFLFFNTKPATVFMGDAGSLFLGMLLAVLGIKLRFPDNLEFVTWMVPVLLLAVPIFDVCLVVVSRLRRGVNPFTTAGKDHLSHRLVKLGLTQLEAVLVIYLVGCFFGVLAIFVMGTSVVEGYQVASVALLFGIWAIWHLEKNESWKETR